MLPWIAALVVVSMLAPRAHADSSPRFDPVGEDGWPKATSLASLRGLPRCEGRLQGEPGAAIPCRPAIREGGAPIAYSTDWTTGLTLASDGASGGSHAWGHELLVAVTRELQLGARYQLIGTGLADDRMASQTLGHDVFALARYRHFTDEVTRSAWVAGAGLGWAARAAGGAPVARLALGHDFGTFVTPTSALTAGLELAYQRSLDGQAQQHVVGSLKLGFELGVREPRNLGAPAPREQGPSIRIGFLGMPAVSLGFDATMEYRRGRLGWNSSLGFQFGMAEDRALTGFDGGQWAALTGVRAYAWQIVYAQAQLGAAWVIDDAGGHAQGLWQAETGLALGCVETGIWARRDFAGERMSGGLLFRVGRSRGPSFCGGRSGEPRFAVEQLPPPPPPVVVEPPPPVVVEPPPPVVVEPPPPVVVRVPPVVIELDVRLIWVGRTQVLQLDPRALAQLQTGRVAVELVGPPALLGPAELQLRQLLGGAGIQVEAWARVAAPGSGIRLRFTIAR